MDFFYCAHNYFYCVFSHSYFSASKKSNIEAEIAQFPGVKLLLEQHPEIREQFIQDALTINDGPDAAAAYSHAASLIQQYFEQYVGQASDESVIEYVHQFLLALDEVSKKNPQFCPAIINDQANETVNEIASVFSPSIIKRLTNAMSKVIETAIENPQSKPQDEWASLRLQQVWDAIDAKNDPNFTLDFTNPNIKPENICYSITIIYKTIEEKLPAAEVGSVLRYMLAP